MRSYPWLCAVTMLAALAIGILSGCNRSSTAEMARAFLKEGIAAQSTLDCESAIAAFTKALDFNSQDAEAYARRSNCHYNLGENGKALSDINHAILLNPRMGGYYCGRALVYQDTGDFEKADADFEKAVLLDPEHKELFDTVKKQRPAVIEEPRP